MKKPSHSEDQESPLAGAPADTDETQRPNGFAIGTVSGMTGLDPHTIRAWERRYGAVRPSRSPRGMRRYGDEDVTRLQLLKALVDSGDAIGSVAQLPNAELRERLVRLTGIASGPSPCADDDGSLPLALLAPRLEQQRLAEVAALGRLRVTSSSSDLAGLLDAVGAEPAEVVVTELASLGAEPLRALDAIQKRCDPQLLVVVYDFAPQALLGRLGRNGARLLRGPIRVAQLRRSIEDFLAIGAAETRTPEPLATGVGREAAAPIFDDVQLGRLLETTSSVDCECPSHLAALVASMGAFERYSYDCESRNPEDELLHTRLAVSSARIRADLEQLLLAVCRHERLPI